MPLGLTARPRLESDVLALYEEGRRLLQAKDVSGGVGRWRAAAEQARARGHLLPGVWLLARLAAAPDLSHPFRWAAYQLSGDWR